MKILSFTAKVEDQMIHFNPIEKKAHTYIGDWRFSCEWNDVWVKRAIRYRIDDRGTFFYIEGQELPSIGRSYRDLNEEERKLVREYLEWDGR